MNAPVPSPADHWKHADSHLSLLEAEAIHIMRESVATSDSPVLLFSGGKDSIVLLHLARKAFYPAPVPVPLLHVDTGHNFAETLAYRDMVVERHGLRLIVASVPDALEEGFIQQAAGNVMRNGLQAPVLLRALREGKHDLAFGGARRDEEAARAKERICSHRNARGHWDPKNQRPELWSLYNTRLAPGEQMRVFPLSNWTELDVWCYIARENIELPSLYYAHERLVFEQDGFAYFADPEIFPEALVSSAQTRTVRFRTIGDISCTGAVPSDAKTMEQVLVEVMTTRATERGATRADDQVEIGAMEERKRTGYF